MENFTCSICLNILENPVQCANCSNNFCEQCVKNIKRCPLCNVEPFEYKLNIWLKRTISGWEFFCPNGCGMKFRDRKELNKHTLICNFCEVKCSLCKYIGSEEVLWAHLIEKHKKEIMEHFIIKTKGGDENSISDNQNDENNLQFSDSSDEEKKTNCSKKNYSKKNSNKSGNKKSNNNISKNIVNNNNVNNNVNNNINKSNTSTFVKNIETPYYTNDGNDNKIYVNNDNFYPEYDQIKQNNTTIFCYNKNYLNDKNNNQNNNNYNNNQNYIDENPYKNQDPKDNDKKINRTNSLINPDLPQMSNIQNQYNNVQDSEIKNVYTNVIKKGHVNNPFTSRTNNNINLLNNLYFCNSRNNDIKCDCCKDHICKVGNCMCVSCMRKNVQNFGLREGELINKSGRIAKIDKGDFYCGCQFEEVYTNVMGKEFRNIKQCKYYSQCNDCKILKKFMKEYLPESVYKRITRKKNNN